MKIHKYLNQQQKANINKETNNKITELKIKILQLNLLFSNRSFKTMYAWRLAHLRLKKKREVNITNNEIQHKQRVKNRRKKIKSKTYKNREAWIYWNKAKKVNNKKKKRNAQRVSTSASAQVTKLRRLPPAIISFKHRKSPIKWLI